MFSLLWQMPGGLDLHPPNDGMDGQWNGQMGLEFNVNSDL